MSRRRCASAALPGRVPPGWRLPVPVTNQLLITSCYCMPQVVQRDNTSLNHIWVTPKRRAVVALIRSVTYRGPPRSSRAHAQGTLTGARVALDVLRDDGRTRV